MRAVNLLPEGDRAKAAPRAAAGSSRIVLGVLAFLVLAMLAVVVTQNQVTSKRDELAKLATEQQTAQQRAAKLGPYGEFAQVKETRVQSVTDLAKRRFDWERLMRELALVLPDGTWITSLDASSAGTPEATSSSGPTTTDTSSAPSAEISGCAKSQSKVAETLVRLRGIYRAQEVKLTSSDQAGADSASGGTAAATDSGSTGGQGCGNDYSFTATIDFGDAQREMPRNDKRVPNRLGGGA